MSRRLRALKGFGDRGGDLSSFDEVVVGRRLQDGTCVCDGSSGNGGGNAPLTVRLLAVGGDGHYLDFVPNRFRSRAPAFFERTGVKVEVIGLGDLATLDEEILADTAAKVYDGYIFLPFLTGTLVELDGLADLTDFVAQNEDVAWTDIFPFNRDMQSVYDNTVRLIPCDGDVHSLFYRKDLFEQFNRTVPRTWDEYSETAAFFHGKEIQIVNGTSTRTVTLSGSCVERKINCHEPYYFNMLVHSTSTQAFGTRSGSLLDPVTFEPLMGEALAETLRHLESQVKYGAEDELLGESCSGLNIERMNAGTCAMTFFWGDIFARGYNPSSVFSLGDNLGIAPTPGVTKVLDRTTGKLVQCTEELCPHGETYADIGRVNRAPYAAAGGWSGGVSGGVSPERQQAMADFLGYACGKEQSIEDVIPFAQGDLFTGTDPYRRSQFDVEKWVERGYPRNTTIDYKTTIQKQLSSPNTVLDVRFPDANKFLEAMHQHIFRHLDESTRMEKSFKDRMAVANSLAEEWRQITRNYDDNRSGAGLPLKSVYQKSLNVYTPPDSGSNDELSVGAIVGIVVGCSLFVAIVSGLYAWWLIRRERTKSNKQWVLKRDELRLTNEILGDGSYGVIVKGYIQGTPVAVKTSHHSVSRLDSAGNEETDVGTSDASSKTISSRLTANQLREDLAALVKLRNPHVTQAIGAMIEKKTVFVAFEFMEHGSLQNILSGSSGNISSDGNKAFEMQWAIQIARGLEFLHSVPPPGGPLLHTELRAANIMIDSSYNAKISNFCLESRVIGSPREQGSLLWAAPEVLNGEKHTRESDVYSYGMVLYEIVARSRPFRVRQTIFTDYTISTLTEVHEEASPAKVPMELGDDPRVLEENEDGFIGEDRGENVSVPQLISRISDLSREPPCRPKIPESADLFVRDICIECWNKNPYRRPTITEIVHRLSREVSPASLTKQLVQRSSVFDSILPQDVQDLLARNEPVPPKSYGNVTVIFSDVVGFTATSSMLTAEEVGDMIRRLFTAYDEVAAKYGVKKLDVIGDAFLGVAGIPHEEPDHAVRAAAFALEAIEIASRTPVCHSKPHLGNLSIRFGLATGPVVATVIGSAQHPKFTLFGTTVNTASRMESSSEADRVQCTVETAMLLKKQGPPGLGVDFRKKMDIKGRGELDTYFLSLPEGGGLGIFHSLVKRHKSKAVRKSRIMHSSSSGTNERLSITQPTIHEDSGSADIDGDEIN